jgi:uncharacterized protein (TIGR03435 family)
VERRSELINKSVLWCLTTLIMAMPTVAQVVATPQTANPSAHLPAYDVASIKPGKSGDGSTLLYRLDGLTATGLPLKFLIKEAYGIEEDQISGAPNWVNSETYDIEAKVDGADAAELARLSADQRKLMLQSFLGERFKLKIHWETKQLPILALVIAKNGPKLQEAKPGDTYPNGIKGPDGKPEGHAGPMTWGRGRLTGQGIEIAALVAPLTQQLGRIVQDKTGIKGKYDVELRWTDDVTAAMGPPDGRAASDSSGPSIFTAIQEQLGLRLDSQRAPVDVLVIDHIERPSAN